MDSEKFINAFEQLRLYALAVIANADLRKDKEAQRVIVAIQDAIDDMGFEMTDAIPDEVLMSYFEGYETGGRALGLKDLAQAIQEDGTVNPEFRKQIHINAVEEVSEDLILDLTTAINTTKQYAGQAITGALATLQSGLSERLITGVSKDEVALRVQQAFLKEGMTSFIAKDGSKLPLDYYSRMITFTKLSQAVNRGHINRYTENDVDLVEISSNNPTCEVCARHRGMVYSISGNSDEFPKLPKELIPFHPHCQCTYRPVDVEYLTEAELDQIRQRVAEGTEEDPRTEKEAKRYEYYQKQRAKANAEKKQFAKMTMYLGADMPETLPAFRRMKRANTSKFQELYSNYLSATHTKNRG